MVKHGQVVWNKGKKWSSPWSIFVLGKTWEQIYGEEKALKMKTNHLKNNVEKNFRSKEAIEKSANKRKGKPRPEEVKDKIALSHLGVPLSEGHKLSLSRSHCDVSGKNNPMFGKVGYLAPGWEGGKSFEPYTSDFNNSLKLFIKKSDGYRCANCSSSGDNKGRLYVHHINYKKNDCSINNLITLCSSCNSKANFGREKWIVYYREKISLRDRIVEFS